MIEVLMERVLAGEERALARAISLVECGGAAAEAVLARCHGARALRIGVTGAPGVGKSTLVDWMARMLLEGDRTVGVVAVDATSPFTGGAVLGDRIRMRGRDGIYLRSMGSRGFLGGVGRGVEEVCRVMEAGGREVILIETVGVGQEEVGVCEVADVVVLVLAPGMGDGVQAMKAGLMEVADIFVVNKGDRGGAEGVLGDLLAEGFEEGRVVRTVGVTGEGVRELLEVVDSCQKRRSACGEKQGKRGERAVLDHLGIAVRSLEGARGFYEGVGMRVAGVETVEGEGVRVMMFGEGAGRVELLEALGGETTIGQFLAKRGEGLHHVALRVTELEGVCEQLRGRGVRLVGDEIKIGAGGHRYRFVHPESTGGVLVELVEGGR